jgi:hypothetical protein
MIPQERGLEGLNVISYSIYPFCLREGISYVSFFGGGRRFLIPHEILKPAPGLLGGLVDSSFTHFLVRSFIRSCVHSSYPYLSLIDPSSPASWLGKGK